MGAASKLTTRKSSPHLKGSVAEKIQIGNRRKNQPGIAAHGGHVSLIDVKRRTAYLQFERWMQGCGMVDVTLKQGWKS